MYCAVCRKRIWYGFNKLITKTNFCFPCWWKCSPISRPSFRRFVKRIRRESHCLYLFHKWILMGGYVPRDGRASNNYECKYCPSRKLRYETRAEYRERIQTVKQIMEELKGEFI